MTEKLATKHNVSVDEIIECFSNRVAGFLLDTRAQHKSDPETRWFVSETNRGRNLKVAFIPIDGDIHIRTGYEANEEEIRIYNKYA